MYEMKEKGLHMGIKNVHNTRSGVVSLIVTNANRDFGDTITITTYSSKVNSDYINIITYYNLLYTINSLLCKMMIVIFKQL